jgi:hypothetical protein
MARGKQGRQGLTHHQLKRDSEQPSAASLPQSTPSNEADNYAGTCDYINLRSIIIRLSRLLLITQITSQTLLANLQSKM